ncbi:MAG: hypothetical protein JWQ96_2644 [Segetibacter sp.]|nr:hypothetical protein [Segetibacter sp.]
MYPQQTMENLLKGSSKFYYVKLRNEGKLLDSNDLFCSEVSTNKQTIFTHLIEEAEQDNFLQVLQNCKTFPGKAFKLECMLQTPAGKKMVAWEFTGAMQQNTMVIEGLGTVREFENNIWDYIIKHKLTQLHYESLFHQNPDAVYSFDPLGNFVSCNNATEALTGYPVTELLNTSFAPLIHPEDVHLALENFQATINGSPRNLDLKLITKKGETKNIFVNVFPIVQNNIITGVYGISKDITDKVAAETKLALQNASLSKAENELKRLMYASMDVICSFDLAGNFIQVSEASQTVLGYSPQELIGTNTLPLIYKEDHGVTLENIIRLHTSGNPVKFRNRYKHKNGKIVTIAWSMKLVKEEGTMYGVGRDVSEKIEAEQNLELSEQRFRTLVQNGADIVGIINEKGIYTYVSPSTKTILGHDAEELIGKNAINYVHPDDQEVARKGLKEVLQKEETRINKFRFLDSSNQWRWIETIASNQLHNPAIQGIVINSRDITERQLQEENLHRTLNHLKLFESIILHSKEAIMIMDALDFTKSGPKIQFVNKAFCDMTGFSAEELIGNRPAILQGSNTNRQAIARMHEAMVKGDTCNEELLNYKKNGETFWCDISVAPVSVNSNQITYFIATRRDITQKKKNEREKELLIEELTKSNNDLRQFTYITSHNIRSPLSNLMGLLQLINFDKLCDENKKFFHFFKTSTLQLNQTITDLMSILVIKNQADIEQNTLNIAAEIEIAKTTLCNIIAESNATIKVHLLQQEIMFNSAYFHSIILNLLTNAIKYRNTRRNLVIDIRSYVVNDYTIIKVRDNGIGIDLNRYRDRVFGLYQRFHSNVDGKGLGLFIIKSQVTALGGKIEVESEVGKGTTFTLSFKNPAFLISGKTRYVEEVIA